MNRFNELRHKALVALLASHDLKMFIKRDAAISKAEIVARKKKGYEIKLNSGD